MDYFMLKGLKEKRARALKGAEEITNKAKEERRQLTSAERDKFDQYHKEFNDLNKQIEGHGDQNGPQYHAGNGSQPTYWNDAEGNRIRVYGKNEKLSSGADVSIGEFVTTMATGRGRMEVKNALAGGQDSTGGYTVPEATLRQFIDRFREKSRVMQAGASTINLDTDHTIIAKVATDPTAQWLAESEVMSETDFTFDKVEFKPKTLRFIVKSSRELMADSTNMSAVLESVFAGTTAVAVDRAVLFGAGSGSNQPKGLTSYDGIPVVDMGTDGALLESYSPLVQAYQKMLENNAPAPTGYIMSPREWGTLADLTDTLGQPLRRPQALEGIPFLESNIMPIDEVHGEATNASRIITGVWSDLMVGFRSEMRIEVLRERFASSYEIGFLVHLRMDSAPVRDESFAMVEGIIPDSAT